MDRFILARLEKEGLPPSPATDRITLIRRVTLDLTGLPPTLSEIDAFLSDDSPDAYDKVVDRLLAYGLTDARIESFPADGKRFYGTQLARQPWDADFAELTTVLVDIA